MRPGRLFVSRMLKWLKVLYRENKVKHPIPNYVKKDLLWWHRFLHQYNGVSMMIYENWSEPDEIFSSDACLSACGGFWCGNYFHVKFPSSLASKSYHINILEMFSVIICLKLWGSFYKGKRIQVFCDNSSVCTVINSGKAKCEILQNGLRELAFLAAIYECEIRAVHLNSEENRLADHLSRWYTSERHKHEFFQLTKDLILKEWEVSDKLFEFINNW